MGADAGSRCRRRSRPAARRRRRRSSRPRGRPPPCRRSRHRPCRARSSGARRTGRRGGRALRRCPTRSVVVPPPRPIQASPRSAPMRAAASRSRSTLRRRLLALTGADEEAPLPGERGDEVGEGRGRPGVGDDDRRAGARGADDAPTASSASRSRPSTTRATRGPIGWSRRTSASNRRPGRVAGPGRGDRVRHDPRAAPTHRRGRRPPDRTASAPTAALPAPAARRRRAARARRRRSRAAPGAPRRVRRARRSCPRPRAPSGSAGR